MLPIRIISFLCKPGKFGQWIAVITVSLCSMTASLGFSWSSGALPKIRRGEAGYDLDLNEQSFAVTSLFVGNLISPIPSAYLMERLGRRNSLCAIIWLQVLAFTLISTVKGFWPLCIARIIKGFWVGLVYTAVPVYIGECSHPKIRGILGTFFGAFLYTGSLLISFIGSYSTYFMLSLIPALITGALGIFLCFIPESPYYYISKGKIEAARASIIWLRGYCDETVLNSIKDSITKQEKQKASYLDVFRRASSRKALFIVSLLGSIQRTSGLAMLLTFTSVTVPNYIVTAEEFMIVLNVVWILSCIGSSFVMDRFDRRTMMAFSCTGSCVTMMGVSIWFYLRDKIAVDVTSIMWLPFVCLMLHGVTYSFGIVSIPTMMPGEIFPPEIKSKASSLVAIWTALVSGIVLNCYLPLQEFVGSYANFLICTISSFVGVLTALFIMIETKGRTLEEIQEELEGKRNDNIIVEATRF